MAVGYGVPVPKGKTRKQLKARKDREDAKQLRAFRDAVWKREEEKVFGERGAPTASQIAKCQYCGCGVIRGDDDWMQTGEVHHRISRRHKASRYDPDNGVLLCNHLLNDCHGKVERGEIEV